MITDKGLAFTSTIIAEITKILEITLKCITTKHLQTIWKLERTRASLETNLKMACGEYCRLRHKFLPLAVLNCKTSHHASIGCELTLVSQGRVPLDHGSSHWTTSLETIQTNELLLQKNLSKKYEKGQATHRQNKGKFHALLFQI